MKKIILILLLLCNVTFASDYWKQPMHGISTFAIAISGENIFIGTYYGVYLSTDYGESWTAKNNGLTSLDITCLAINDNVLIAGTYERGLFRSTNNGDSWTAINNGLPALYIEFLVVNERKIFTKVDDWNKGGLFQSTNNGESWSRVNFSNNTNFVNCLEVYDSIIYLGTSEKNKEILFSSDNGENWNVFKTDLPVESSVKNIAFKDSVIFVVLGDLGVYRSTDFGNSWTEANNGIECYDEITNIEIINDKVFTWSCYSNRSYMTSNNGENWSPFGFNNQNSSLVCFIIQNGLDVFAGTYSGLYLSKDNCENWKALNSGLSNSHILSLYFNDSFLYAGTSNGLYKSINYGDNWSEIQGNLPYFGSISSIVKKGNKFFVGCSNSSGITGVLCSEDNGESWVSLNKGLTDTSITSLVLNNGNLYAGTWNGKIFFSSNDGESWKNITVLNSYFPTNLNNVTILIKDSVIYAGTSYGVYKSTNNGDFWRQITYEMSNTNVYCLSFVGDELYLGTENGVIYTSDYGANWIELNKGMEELEVYSLNFFDSYIFAGTHQNGVFLSTDKGENWVGINSGLYCKDIRCLEILDSVLYAGTYGGGTYCAKISDIIISNVQEQTVQTYEISVFPNPASNQITLSIPEEQNINSISIFNSLGMEVKRIEQSEIIGNNKITISVADLPVGLYHCSFVNQTGRVTKSFVVVR